MTVSTRALTFVTTALRAHHRQLRTRWRLLSSGRQALVVLAHLRKGETYRDLGVGFGVGTTTAYRYLREALHVLAALAPTLQEGMAAAARKAYVTLDGTLLRIDRIAMATGNGYLRPTRRCGRSTNPIESMIEICREHAKNVKNWQDGQMALRWAAAGMLEAGKQFRRVNGHLHLPALRAALEAEVAKTVGPVIQNDASNAA